jgi:hypothetical protein
MTEDLSEKAIYLLDQSISAVFRRYELVQQYGPVDRYGVVEWAANVPDLSPFTKFIDVSGVTLDVAFAVWHSPEIGEELIAIAQLTLGARSDRYLTRWHFAPVTLPTLQDSAACERILGEAVDEFYESKRTLSAIQSVVSPEDAPSDMTVLPVFEGSVSEAQVSSYSAHTL